MTLCTVWMNVEGVRSGVMGLGWLIKLYPPQPAVTCSAAPDFQVVGRSLFTFGKCCGRKVFGPEKCLFLKSILSVRKS
jgi:hypothetical protein